MGLGLSWVQGGGLGADADDAGGGCGFKRRRVQLTSRETWVEEFLEWRERVEAARVGVMVGIDKGQSHAIRPDPLEVELKANDDMTTVDYA